MSAPTSRVRLPLTTAGLLLRYAVWRATGLDSVGRGLIEALERPNPTARTTAGMLLVRAGAVSLPLLEEALRNRESLPLVLAVLADIGDPRVETPIAALARDADPEVARAAAQALRVLKAPRRPTVG